MSTPNWDRSLLGGSGRKTAEVQRSRSSVGASSLSTSTSPSRKSSGYSPKPYKKRSQRVLLHDLSDPTSLPSQLAAAQQAAAAAGKDVPPSYTSHYFSLPPVDYLTNKKNRFVKQHEQEQQQSFQQHEKGRGSEAESVSAKYDMCLDSKDLEDVPVTDTPLYTEAYRNPKLAEDIGNRINTRASARTRRTAFAQKPIEQKLMASLGDSATNTTGQADMSDTSKDGTTSTDLPQYGEKSNNAHHPYSSYYQHYPHHYYKRPQNMSSLRQARSLSTSPPPSQASTSASCYTAAAASRIGERGVGSSHSPNHSPLHISSSFGHRVVHPRRTPLSATLSDAVHPSFNHHYSGRDQFYHGSSGGLPHPPSLQRAKSCNRSGDDNERDRVNQYLPMQLSQQQAEARNLVLNEIKALQLRRQSSFKRVLRMPPIWRTAQAAASFQGCASSPSSAPRMATNSATRPPTMKGTDNLHISFSLTFM